MKLVEGLQAFVRWLLKQEFLAQVRKLQCVYKKLYRFLQVCCERRVCQSRNSEGERRVQVTVAEVEGNGKSTISAPECELTLNIFYILDYSGELFINLWSLY